MKTLTRPVMTDEPLELPELPIDAEAPTRRKAIRSALLASLLVLLTRLPFLVPGYGLDFDGWMVVNAARWMSQHFGEYIASRLPGYPVQEITTSFFCHGGPLVINSVTALISAALVFFFILILAEMGCRDAVLAGVALAFIPIVYITSVVPMDYLWALMFAMASYYAALRRRPVIAGLLLGLATGCRITTLAMLPAFLLLLIRPVEPAEAPAADPAAQGWAPLLGYQFRMALTMAASAVLMAALCFLPVILRYGRGFFTYYPSNEPFTAIIKNCTTEVWGFIGVVAVAGALLSLAFPAWRRGESTFLTRPTRLHLFVWVSLILFYAVEFFNLPLESGYLIPTLPFALLLFAYLLPRKTFRFLCIALLFSPFLLTLRGPASMPAPRWMSLRMPDQWNLLYLPGPLIDEYQLRWRQHIFFTRMGKFVARLQKPTVIVAVWAMPSMDILMEDQGGYLLSTPKEELPKPWCWEKSFRAMDKRGLVQFRCLLNAKQLHTLQQQGYTVYYLPGMDRIAWYQQGFNPIFRGAKRIRIPTSGKN